MDKAAIKKDIDYFNAYMDVKKEVVSIFEKNEPNATEKVSESVMKSSEAENAINKIKSATDTAVMAINEIKMEMKEQSVASTSRKNGSNV